MEPSMVSHAKVHVFIQSFNIKLSFYCGNSAFGTGYERWTDTCLSGVSLSAMPRRVEGGPWGRATGQHPSFRANKEPSYTTQEIASGPGSHVESMRRCQQTNDSTLTLPHRRWTPPCSFARLQENISISNSVLSSALTLWDILPENHTSDSQVLKHVRSSCCFL